MSLAGFSSSFLPSWFNIDFILTPFFNYGRSSRALILLLLQRGGIHPNPGPASQSFSPSPLPTILQFNCNGIRSSVAEVNNFLCKNRISVAALQETKLSEKSADPSFPNYILIRKDRPGGGGGGGLAFLVHHSLPFTPLSSPLSQDKIIECQGISVTLNGSSIEVFNLYIPPASGCPRGYSPDLSPLLNLPNDSLVLGDINAHHPSWDSSLSDVRGDSIAASIDQSPLLVLNEDTATRIPSAQNQPSSSPDISLASAHLAIELTWSTRLTLNSDHLPILIEFPSNQHPQATRVRTYTNFSKADWPRFIREVEEILVGCPLPTSCSSGEKIFRDALLTSAKHSIPAGFVQNSVPGLSREVVDRMEQRDEIRRVDPHSPEITQLNREIASEVSDNKRRIWREKIEAIGRGSDPRRLWRVVRSLNGKRSYLPPNQPISFDSVPISDKKSIANKFINQFTPRPRSNKKTRVVLRHIHNKFPIDHSLAPFSTDLVEEAIRASSGSTATGPDGLAPEHFKHLGGRAVKYLTALFNLSVGNSDIPAIWKQALILPIAKPGKPASQGSSFRPISLLCPAAKILERLLLPQITEALQPADFQHGFRPRRSTVTALLPITNLISEGFNQNKPPRRSVVVALDLSKAFDSVDITLLLEQITGTDLHPNIVRWLATYLRGRSAACIYQGVRSVFRNIHMGVPQGSVLSPALFNFFVSDCPDTLGLMVMFADDLSAAASALDLHSIENVLNKDMVTIAAWAKRKSLTISSEKSQVTFFSPDRKESYVHPQIFYEGSLIKLERNPKILGLILDPHFTFSAHLKSSLSKIPSRSKVIKAITRSGWGLPMEDARLTFRATIEPIINYASPLWKPIVSKSGIERLQSAQNMALRQVTGCHAAASMDHVHQECKLMPVDDHLNLLSCQFLANAMQPSHPSHEIVTAACAPRPNMKPSLQTKYGSALIPYLTDSGVISALNYKKVLAALHTSAVNSAISRLKPNRVLDTAPPEINPEEKQLPRAVRTTLCQLRSGFCRGLRTYLHKIGSSDDDQCPDCHLTQHSSSHLFNCPANPTDLVPGDLWKHPREAAEFLASLPSFDYLPPLDPMLPPPPPEPPPGRAGGGFHQ